MNSMRKKILAMRLTINQFKKKKLYQTYLSYLVHRHMHCNLMQAKPAPKLIQMLFCNPFFDKYVFSLKSFISSLSRIFSWFPYIFHHCHNKKTQTFQNINIRVFMIEPLKSCSTSIHTTDRGIFFFFFLKTQI